VRDHSAEGGGTGRSVHLDVRWLWLQWVWFERKQFDQDHDASSGRHARAIRSDYQTNHQLDNG